MDRLTRRTIFTALGLAIPLLTAAEANPTRIAAHFARSTKYRNAVLAVGQWLAEHPKAGALLSNNASPLVSDIRQSFAAGPLVSVDGLLLPAGFCRYCIAAHHHETRANQPGVG